MTTATDKSALVDRLHALLAVFSNTTMCSKRRADAWCATLTEAIEAISSSASSETPPVSEDVEKCWQEFWAPIVAPNGVLNLNQVKLELADFRDVMHEVSIAYDHVTGGRISKPNTLARHVIAAADDLTNEACAEAVTEAREEWEAGGGVVEAASSETQEERPDFDDEPNHALDATARNTVIIVRELLKGNEQSAAERVIRESLVSYAETR